MKKLSIDNPFFEFMGNLGDMMLLNLLYVATCLPVVTIGMATTALYQVLLRRARKESSYVIREYIAACKKEWKKSTCLWMALLLTGSILAFDVLYTGVEWKLVKMGVGCLILIWLMVFSYTFPLQARFENTCGNTLKNAWSMAVRHLPYTLLIVAINCIPMLCILAGDAVMLAVAPLYFVVGFAAAARLNAVMFGKIFEKYMESEGGQA